MPVHAQGRLSLQVFLWREDMTNDWITLVVDTSDADEDMHYQARRTSEGIQTRWAFGSKGEQPGEAGQPPHQLDEAEAIALRDWLVEQYPLPVPDITLIRGLDWAEEVGPDRLSDWLTKEDWARLGPMHTDRWGDWLFEARAYNGRLQTRWTVNGQTAEELDPEGQNVDLSYFRMTDYSRAVTIALRDWFLGQAPSAEPPEKLTSFFGCSMWKGTKPIVFRPEWEHPLLSNLSWSDLIHMAVKNSLFIEKGKTLSDYDLERKAWNELEEVVGEFQRRLYLFLGLKNEPVSK